jgi:hypothetical protein
VIESRGDEPRGVAPTVQERIGVRSLPDVIHNWQDAQIASASASVARADMGDMS